eukprot:9410301-Pyramimonas_sp.AAC.1
MAKKRRRQTHASPPGDFARSDDGRTEAGENLIQCLLELYARCVLSAKDVCVISHYASKAGA